MALGLKNTYCVDKCIEFTVSDSTGIYDPITNDTGWEAPNPTRAGITSALLSITLPDEDDPIIDEEDVTATVQAAGTVTEVFELQTYTLTDFGYSTTMLDGIYTIKYVVISGGTTYTLERQMLNFCNVKSCVQKMFSNYVIALSTCGCNSKDTQTVMNAYVLLKALMMHAVKGNLTEADSIRVKLETICTTNNCC